MRYAFTSSNVDVHEAFSPSSVDEAVRAVLTSFRHRLPSDVAARIVVKPNLNNDLVALTGNSTDLRVLCALLGGLRDLGYVDVTVADGPNVGVARRGIDVFK